MPHFISPEERAYMSPSSSPDTSPDPFASSNDSSPLSSPSLEPIDLHDPPSPPTGVVSHPFAGSTHATRRPPLYEKKPDVPIATPSGTSPSSSGLLDVMGTSTLSRFDRKAAVPAHEEVGNQIGKIEDWEASLWEDKISWAIDNAAGNFDLMNENLTCIPLRIGDLANLVLMPDKQPGPTARSFTRSHTAPATSAPFSQRRSLFFGGQDNELKLFLAQNQISSLPAELFTLQNLTVLSLRNNSLTYLPPQIAQLRSLRELNVANNRLTLLPAEMTAMRLEVLAVSPNPFLPDPAAQRKDKNETRVHSVGPVKPKSGRVTPLTELILRYLISPAPAPSSLDPPHLASSSCSLLNTPSGSPPTQRRALTRDSTPTNLAHYFQLPIPESIKLRPDFMQILASSVPGAVSVSSPSKPRKSLQTASDTNMSSDGSSDTLLEDRLLKSPATDGKAEILGMSRCPAPHHYYNEFPGEEREEGDWVWNGAAFVLPAEERVVWVENIAGVKVGSAYAGIPLLWRGCCAGCLDFLAPRNSSLQEGASSDDQARPAEEEVISVDGDGDIVMA
ncbi:hypothetical protein EW146_g1431 [Bondarzewia mesenterica]|uniref:Uncharacterized protein n=1 Tax=Bondarzewia mesenterica TaxID=1095465 RepID=A0A4S4M4A8_9AGAM|nr:hypothetical protein EW146_g1431 [Bondarzewia mesenterica]